MIWPHKLSQSLELNEPWVNPGFQIACAWCTRKIDYYVANLKGPAIWRSWYRSISMLTIFQSRITMTRAWYTRKKHKIILMLTSILSLHEKFSDLSHVSDCSTWTRILCHELFSIPLRTNGLLLWQQWHIGLTLEKHPWPFVIAYIISNAWDSSLLVLGCLHPCLATPTSTDSIPSYCLYLVDNDEEEEDEEGMWQDSL